MTTPPFVFDHRTGEIQREGIATSLNMLQASIFGVLAAQMIQGAPIGTGAIAKQINEHPDDVEDEIFALIRRLRPLGIRIAHEKGKGRWLEFEAIKKFELKIAPPVRLEGEGP